MNLYKFSCTLLFILLAGAVLISCQAAGIAQVEVMASGSNVTESRSVSGFHTLNASGNGHFKIDRNGTESFEITMDDSLLPYMDIRVSNGTLYVQPKANVTLVNDHGYTVTLSARDLDAITLQGNTNALVQGIETPLWKAELNGNNFIELEGSAARQQIEIAGNARYDAQNLASQQAVVNAEGNTSVVVRVSDELEANAQGLARIEYIGAPLVREKVESMASVKQRAAR